MKSVWIGLFGVGALPGRTSLGDAKGAYVNALALATDAREYENTVKRALEELGLFAFEVEEVEQYETRAVRCQIDPALTRLSDEVQECGQVRFGDFHTYLEFDG